MPYKDPTRRREYHRVYMRGWYRRNRSAHVERVTRRRHVVRQWYEDMKRALACSHCGERHPACIQFHHRDRATKEFDISAASRGELALDRLVAEIKKCDVLCANCHLKLHWEINHQKRTPRDRRRRSEHTAEVPGTRVELVTNGL